MAITSDDTASDPLLTEETVKRLLRWFEEEGVSYPWGDAPTPYRVWVSEIMLQQTVVTAAIDHFKRWTSLFPGVEALAAAGEQAVLRAWEGLGYYSRARNLRKGAFYLMEHHDGELPDEYDALIKIPGIGDYTARALLSLAFGKPWPVLDANVKRIGLRLTARRNPEKGWEVSLLKTLERSIPGDAPGLFNCGLMQLGQQICRAKSPLCRTCPLAPECLGFRNGIQEEIPPARIRKVREKTSVLLLLEAEGSFLLERRDSGIGRGLWFIPSCPPADEAEYRQTLNPRQVISLPEKTHSYTVWRERLIPFFYHLEGGVAAVSLPPAGKEVAQREWVEADRVGEYPMPSVYRRIFKELPYLQNF